MKLSSKQKIYLGALALAGGAFAVDRLFFSPPVASARPPATARSIATKKPTAAPRPPTEELTDLSAISNRLTLAAAASDTHDASDGFRPSPAWVDRASARGRATQPTPAEQFRSQHRLLAVMTGQQAGWIILDGKTLGIGQSIGGFRLVEVRESSALFQSNEMHVELQLSK